MPTMLGTEAVLARAREGDGDAFRQLVEPYRRALQLHCYRMLGSLEDAEDLVQDTLLRAWRRLSTFRGEGSIRGWLYRIATNACLDALAARPRRMLPQERSPATWRPGEGAISPEVPWLSPYPDSLLDRIADPRGGADARYDERESVRIAFVAAIQHLPPRQRAVLLLRDVLGWRASEVAEALETSPTAVHSALQRARGTLRRAFPDGLPERMPQPASEQEALLNEFVRSWETGDLGAFIALLREDAVVAMPPSLDWYCGRESVAEFFRWAWDVLGPFRLLPTTSNRQPAFGLYVTQPGRAGFQAMAIQVLELDGAAIRSITAFVDPTLFSRFGLPALLPS